MPAGASPRYRPRAAAAVDRGEADNAKFDALRSVPAGAAYFALVFACGWVLGPIRELVVVPWLGHTAGVMIEAPLMVAAMIIAARWTVRRFAIPRHPGPRLVVGSVAFDLLVIAELAGAVWLRGLAVEDYLASLATVPGGITIALFLLFGAMPALVDRR